ncbi:MAG TPA: hypothetical protein VHQ86_04010, partial [Candidatus Saccharimonadia bacterium]|nr:hypothetical protein [Candidatus Saccharimonadia bacterium]
MSKPNRVRRRTSNFRILKRRLALVGVFVVAILIFPNLGARAATLSSASLAIADPRPSTLSTNYTFTGSN